MRTTLLILSMVALGGCDAMEKGFDQGFDKKFGESCRASASKSVSATLAGQLCDCALTRINQRLTRADKMSGSDAKFSPIIDECVKTVVQK